MSNTAPTSWMMDLVNAAVQSVDQADRDSIGLSFIVGEEIFHVYVFAANVDCDCERCINTKKIVERISKISNLSDEPLPSNTAVPPRMVAVECEICTHKFRFPEISQKRPKCPSCGSKSIALACEEGEDDE